MLRDLLDTKQEWRIWQLLDVRYVASRRAIDDKGVESAFSGDGVIIYRMRYPLGRAWLVDSYEVIASEAAALGASSSARIRSRASSRPGPVAFLRVVR